MPACISKMPIGQLALQHAEVELRPHQQLLEVVVQDLREPATLPDGLSARWFVLDCVRQHLKAGTLPAVEAPVVDRFLRALPDEHQLALVTDLVERWAELGAEDAMLALLARVAALPSRDGADAHGPGAQGTSHEPAPGA